MLREVTAAEVAAVMQHSGQWASKENTQSTAGAAQLQARIAALWEQLRTSPAHKLAMLQRFAQCTEAAQAERELAAWERAAASMSAREAALAVVLDVRSVLLARL